jgi:hypothetical protein
MFNIAHFKVGHRPSKSDAWYSVGLTHTTTQARSDLLQKSVAERVSESIIDMLEMIDQHHRLMLGRQGRQLKRPVSLGDHVPDFDGRRKASASFSHSAAISR